MTRRVGSGRARLLTAGVWPWAFVGVSSACSLLIHPDASHSHAPPGSSEVQQGGEAGAAGAAASSGDGTGRPGSAGTLGDGNGGLEGDGGRHGGAGTGGTDAVDDGGAGASLGPSEAGADADGAPEGRGGTSDRAGSGGSGGRAAGASSGAGGGATAAASGTGGTAGIAGTGAESCGSEFPPDGTIHNELASDWSGRAESGAGPKPSTSVSPDTSEGSSFQGQHCFCVNGHLHAADGYPAWAYAQLDRTTTIQNTVTLDIAGAQAGDWAFVRVTGTTYCHEVQDGEVNSPITTFTLRPADFAADNCEGMALTEDQEVDTVGYQANSRADREFNFCILKVDID